MFVYNYVCIQLCLCTVMFVYNYVCIEFYFLRSLVLRFHEILNDLAQRTASRLYLFIDGLDLLDDLHQLTWIPEVIPEVKTSIN